MNFLISTVDPPPTVAEPPDAGAAELADVEVAGVEVAGVEAAGELVPPPFELEPHAVATARTAISATKTNSGRRGPIEDLRDVSARFIRTPIHQGRTGVIA